eukprot:Hpha_TRINITY_DN15296_c1_g2::TRINITY_DN15296_c1_g2_i1::g.66202::m.66202
MKSDRKGTPTSVRLPSTVVSIVIRPPPLGYARTAGILFPAADHRSRLTKRPRECTDTEIGTFFWFQNLSSSPRYLPVTVSLMLFPPFTPPPPPPPPPPP